jgi:LPPG:FO 2-phospho-L-lactate transferase
MTASSKKILALSGGVGGAKLARGLAQVMPPENLAIVCNTADDFEHMGLIICPDLDSVMYALAGRNDTGRGWGLADETWHVMNALKAIHPDAWFQLGDKDLATHLARTEILTSGQPLSVATRALCDAYGVAQTLLPMTDDRVRTKVATENGEMDFQTYFVREQCQPAVTGFRFDGIGHAAPHPQWMEWLAAADLRAVILCPSNPFVSMDPILKLPGVREAIRSCAAPVIAVSPIVGNKALKGPAAKMMHELGMPATATAVAAHYGGLLTGFVLDQLDQDQEINIQLLNISTLVTDTIMKTPADMAQLAEAVLAFAERLAS